MAQAASEYLAANLLAERLGCGWIIGHGGYHFGDLELRRAAATSGGGWSTAPRRRG